MTVRFTLAEFGRRPAFRGGDGELSSYEVTLARLRAVTIDEGYEFGRYRIHRARHARNPGTQQRMCLEHGEALTIARSGKYGTIGLVRRDLMWVHEAHRGNGLGPELCAEMLQMMGCESWSKTQWIEWLDTPQLTEAGFRNRAKVFRKLVERGIIEEV